MKIRKKQLLDDSTTVMLKKISIFISSVIMFINSTMFPLECYAEGRSDKESTQINQVAGQQSDYDEYLKTLGAAELNAIAKKEDRIDRMVKAYNISVLQKQEPAAALKNFKMYAQETNTYCVPACVKSALKYIKNKSYKQSSIHRSTRKKLTNVPKYINKKQDKTVYIYKNRYENTKVTQNYVKQCIKSDISIDKVPTFFAIRVPYSGDWPYPTTGHCVLVYGYTKGFKNVKIGEPLKNIPKKYQKSLKLLYRYSDAIVF